MGDKRTPRSRPSIPCRSGGPTTTPIHRGGARQSDARPVPAVELSESSGGTHLHHGALTAGPETLDDGPIRRYDTSHEDTKGHELHVALDPEPAVIEFPGIEELYERFWDEIPKPRFGPSNHTGDTNV